MWSWRAIKTKKNTCKRTKRFTKKKGGKLNTSDSALNAMIKSNIRLTRH